MTATHDAVAVGARSVAAAVNVLRAEGLRVSAARRSASRSLYAARRPVTAEQIASGLGGALPRSDIASVYRNLETLERIGLVRHLHVGHGPGLYARAHIEYAVCERCETVIPLDAAQVEQLRAAIHDVCGLDVRFSHFPLVGVCASCERVAAATGPGTSFRHPASGSPAHTPA